MMFAPSISRHDCIKAPRPSSTDSQPSTLNSQRSPAALSLLKQRERGSAFTLLELLIVVGIIGLLLVDTSSAGQPTVNFYQGGSSDRAVLDFFSYNPVSSSYPRAGIINLNTRNEPTLAAALKGAVSREPNTTVTASQAASAAHQIFLETVTSNRPAVTRADVTRLAEVAGTQIGASEEEKETIARALAELGQTRTWNLLIDVIAQTGRYSPDATNINQANKFTVEGEKRYWLHIALGRDLNDDGSVDVLGTQLEEVIE